ncbi:hypothetical protein SAMN05216337_1001165 [Bradyrhizobium brasilense]|uniref:Uncharacterized protein n=1 Tax=Bradyrhizobium brasilense TaxID=1419277 RepID=A0A1G6IIZ4_9BRAD|nr:hypothetical protein [Bradyrhizobium brasilense]SDC06499.1 hypothetical protein SAMN05216337_1001165 [Bradyrhizobium brasilense]
MPRLLKYVWDMFREVHAGIQGNGWTHPVITWETLKAWSDETDQRLEPRDARVVVELGQRRAAILNAAQAKKNAGKD